MYVRVYVAASAATWNTTTFSKLFDYYFLLQFSLTCSFAYIALISRSLSLALHKMFIFFVILFYNNASTLFVNVVGVVRTHTRT